MMIPRLLRSPRGLIAVAAVAAGALACRDTTTPGESSGQALHATGPVFTSGVAFTSTLVGRANLGSFNVKSKDNHYDVQLKSNDNTDVVVATIVVGPGGTSGWHLHPGPAVVVVKTGSVTTYHGDDPSCSPTLHPAGSSFIEDGGMVHIARNEGTVNANLVTTYFVPAGSPTRIDADDPGNCSF
jgi:hypothetical protein